MFIHGHSIERHYLMTKELLFIFYSRSYSNLASTTAILSILIFHLLSWSAFSVSKMQWLVRFSIFENASTCLYTTNLFAGLKLLTVLNSKLPVSLFAALMAQPLPHFLISFPVMPQVGNSALVTKIFSFANLLVSLYSANELFHAPSLFSEIVYPTLSDKPRTSTLFALF